MSVTPNHPSPLAGEGDSPQASGERARGLSPRTQALWLAAIRHRQLADAIAAGTRKAAP